MSQIRFAQEKNICKHAFTLECQSYYTVQIHANVKGVVFLLKQIIFGLSPMQSRGLHILPSFAKQENVFFFFFFFFFLFVFFCFCFFFLFLFVFFLLLLLFRTYTGIVSCNGKRSVFQ